MRTAKSRIAAVDRANLVLDHAGQVNVFLVAGLLANEGFVGADGTVDTARLRATVGQRIAERPGLRKLSVVVGSGNRWVAASPDLHHHIRLHAPVDGFAGLERLCGELMSVPLARDRPMWELLVIPGTAVGRIAFVLRIHHAIADGMAAVQMVRQLFEATQEMPAPRPSVSYPAPPATPAPRRGLRHTLNKLAYSVTRMRMTFSGHEVSDTVLLGDRSPRRGVAFVDTDLAALEARMRPLDATVNDALLTAVAAGYRAALVAAGEALPARLPISVPVALQRHGTSGNQVGIMLVRLPLDEDRPDERLRLIAQQTRTEKVRAREQGTLEFMRGPVGARIMDTVAHRQHLVAGFVTNVPGPAGTLSLAGARVVAIWPVAVLAANVRLGVAAVSYAGRLNLGIHFDAANVAGAEFTDAVTAELARLGG